MFSHALLAMAVLPVLATDGLSQSGEPGDAVYTLSPFTVDGSNDVGYRATNTLAGSRLNSELRDTAAPISVFTKDLIQDLGANDVQSATFYSVNTEEFTEAEVGDQAGNQLQNDGLQFNIRGFKTSATRNYFDWGLNSDNFNTERIDFSRGPNSILYGLGSPGGVVNTSTKQANMENAYGVELQLSSWDGFRVALDANQVLVDEKLAIRVNLLKSDQDSWIRTKFKDQERVHVAATFQPFRFTKIRGEFERGDVDQVKPRPWGPLDGFSAWEAAGKPTIDTARGEIPEGAASLGGSTRLTYTSDGASVADWSLMGQSDSGRFNYAIFDFDRVPREFDAIGLGSRVDLDYDTFSLYLEQRILENLNVELSFNKQESQSEENRPINWNAPLRVDINAQLPDGSTNPNFGKYYVEDSWRGFRMDDEKEIARATLSYEFDFKDRLDSNVGAILGRHRIAGLLEEKEDYGTRFNLRELNSTPFEQLNDWTNSRNRIYRRTYIDFETDEGYYGALSPQDNPLGSQAITTRTGLSGTVTPAFLPDNFNGSITELDTEMLAVQSYWLDGRLVTTYGHRKDSQRSQGATRLKEDGNNIVTGFRFDQEFGDWASGTTETVGLVFHPTSSISVFYNDSESINLGNPNRYMVDGTVVGDEKGFGEDYGVRFYLLEDRVSLSVSKYETASTNRLTFNVEGPIRQVSNDIWEVLDQSKVVEDGLGIASTEDLVSEGYELELVANPTDRWSIIANLSDSETKVDNIASRNIAYFESNRANWLANSSVAIDIGNPNYGTVGEAVAFLDDQILTRATAFNGRMKLSHSDLKGSMFTNYRFAEDSNLSGFSVGGGMRYASEPVIGYSVADSAGKATKFEGDSNFVVDAKVGYKREINDGKVMWNLQLNVRNLFDNDDIILTLADSSGENQRYRFQEPRQWSLTSRFEF
ncbi:TonB-dependent receptor plug domain-containing protein [Pelagicoccus enzymogenes]|nr:TonB-dependent receptor plug domain-containing protein [Pelagicoccus enzymogenes]